MDRRFNMVSFSLTVTVAFIGYGLTERNPYIFLVPLLMLAFVQIQLNRLVFTLY